MGYFKYLTFSAGGMTGGDVYINGDCLFIDLYSLNVNVECSIKKSVNVIHQSNNTKSKYNVHHKQLLLPTVFIFSWGILWDKLLGLILGI